MDMSKTKQGKNLPKWKRQVTKTRKDAYENNKLQLWKQSSIFINKNKSLLSATSNLSRSPMAYNATASLDKLTCTDHVDSGNCQDRFRQFTLSKNDSNDFGVKLEVFKKYDNKEFRLVQNLTMGRADFNQFMPLRNQLVNAAENFAKEENLSPEPMPTLQKDMDERFKLAHKMVDAVNWANR